MKIPAEPQTHTHQASCGMAIESRSRSAYLTKSDLKTKHGLSAKWVERLGHPDRTVPNPYCRRGAPMQLYLETRVEDLIEQNRTEYEKSIQVSKKRRATGLAIAERRKAETLAWADEVPIKIHWSGGNLERAARMHASRRGRDDGETDRLIVNMLRHEYSNYHRLLRQLYRQVGRWEAYRIIGQRVNTVICDRFQIPNTPENTGDECEDAGFLEEAWGESSESDP